MIQNCLLHKDLLKIVLSMTFFDKMYISCFDFNTIENLEFHFWVQFRIGEFSDFLQTPNVNHSFKRLS